MAVQADEQTYALGTLSRRAWPNRDGRVIWLKAVAFIVVSRKATSATRYGYPQSVQGPRKQPAILAHQPGLILGQIEHLDHQLARTGAQGTPITAHHLQQRGERGLVALFGRQALARLAICCTRRGRKPRLDLQRIVIFLRIDYE